MVHRDKRNAVPVCKYRMSLYYERILTSGS